MANATAYGAKPSRTTNINNLNNKVMTHEEYIIAIAPFEDFRSRANNCTDDKFKSELMRAYNKGLVDIGQKILIENNIIPYEIISQPNTPIVFEPTSARIDKNNDVILVGYLYQDHTNYKVRKEYKLNSLFK